MQAQKHENILIRLKLSLHVVWPDDVVAGDGRCHSRSRSPSRRHGRPEMGGRQARRCRDQGPERQQAPAGAYQLICSQFSNYDENFAARAPTHRHICKYICGKWIQSFTFSNKMSPFVITTNTHKIKESLPLIFHNNKHCGPREFHTRNLMRVGNLICIMRIREDFRELLWPKGNRTTLCSCKCVVWMCDLCLVSAGWWQGGRDLEQCQERHDRQQQVKRRLVMILWSIVWIFMIYKQSPWKLVPWWSYSIGKIVELQRNLRYIHQTVSMMKGWSFHSMMMYAAICPSAHK